MATRDDLAHSSLPIHVSPGQSSHSRQFRDPGRRYMVLYLVTNRKTTIEILDNGMKMGETSCGMKVGTIVLKASLVTSQSQDNSRLSYLASR
jgi:hypothetical protein